jgi:hypothetical protein
VVSELNILSADRRQRRDGEWILADTIKWYHSTIFVCRFQVKEDRVLVLCVVIVCSHATVIRQPGGL